MKYFNFLEEKVDPKQLLWNHYIKCCNVLDLEVDVSCEEYFENMSDAKVLQFLDFLIIESK